MIRVHNITLHRLTIARRIEGYTNLKVLEKSSVCPLPRDATVCVRSEASKAALLPRQFYGSIVTTKDHIADISEHTLRIIVQGVGRELGDAIDKFVQRRSRWIVDITQGDGYELLTTFEEPRRLAFMSQLDLIQHRCTNFFNGAMNSNGFGSKWHSNFIPLTSCTEADMKRAFKESPPEHVFANWNASTINFQTVGGYDLDDLASQSYIKTITPGFEDKDLFWLRSMVVYYATRPNYQLREQFRQYSPIRTPCMSIHVRHSDKRLEATLLELPDYMNKAEEYKSQTGVSNIYLMTDDGNVIKSTEQYKNFQFQYLDMPRPNEAWYTEEAQGMPLDMLERDFLLDVYAAVQCEHQILTYSSNVGRLIGELSCALRNKEPSLVTLDKEWLMWP
ncbi:hypothetical protein BKA57DRAFT_478683 [Linnemannia elongata]|nr:hypothetical protein BKA57DRAFT_479804 [Linnemannia elongata]KAH7030430.1 hypothetical protein BKA57DRAFT_478683 [Linnemannia elongata]